MKEHYELCLEQLRNFGLTEAACHPGRFFRLVTDRTAFILNITLEEDAYLSLVYGFTSTAFFAMGPGEKEFFLKEGCRSDDITLRRCLDAWDRDSLTAAEGAIRAFFDAYQKTDKDALLEMVKADRKEFITQVGALLKPHKFRKKGNLWTKSSENGLTLEFHAQKSAYSDEYYFNIRTYPTGASPYPGCFQTRITAGNRELFDWQLLDRQALMAALENGIRQRLLPFLTDPLTELGQREWVWQSCACQRTCCKPCWVRNNLWEYNEKR